ncbi:MAG: hypothetical protein H6828_12425 [Planctomycetes bacterium]|nr:hypothetical protein [Planctomycetota bacterium]
MQRPNAPRRRAFAAALLALLPASCLAPAGGEVDLSSVQAHNQRPFIGRDTQTTPDSFFELEGGVSSLTGDGLEVPVTLKYGMGPRSEFFVGSSPYKMVDHNELAPDGSGWGDSILGVRHRFRDKDMYYPAVGFQVATKVPTGRESKGLGTGEMDLLGMIMAEQTYQGFDVAASYQLGVLGDPVGNGFDHEHTLAVQGRRPVSQQLVAFGETAFVFAPEQNRDELTVMGGLEFVIDDFTLFDVALRAGVSDDAPDLQLVFGFTRTLGLLAFPQGDAPR